MRSLGLLTFMLPVGFSQASSLFVGKAIGEGKARLAMQYYRVCLFIALLITIIQIPLLTVYMDEVIGLYTTQDSIES